jgi:hypothetical protein
MSGQRRLGRWSFNAPAKLTQLGPFPAAPAPDATVIATLRSPTLGRSARSTSAQPGEAAGSQPVRHAQDLPLPGPAGARVSGKLANFVCRRVGTISAAVYSDRLIAR